MLRADGEARAARVRELEADLYAAAATIERLGGEARGRGERLPEADRSGAPPRPAAWESRHAATDSPADRELRAAARQFSDSMSALPEPAPDGAARLLIRSDGEREVVHVLGRKTSVGRTPDNDLQIEAKYISRHHAVILVGPVHTIIEDLNSTNGVLVNGRRITRQTLKDGDQVVIGRALYRFAVRRASDKR